MHVLSRLLSTSVDTRLLITVSDVIYGRNAFGVDLIGFAMLSTRLVLQPFLGRRVQLYFVLCNLSGNLLGAHVLWCVSHGLHDVNVNVMFAIL